MLTNNCQSHRTRVMIGASLKMREVWGHGCSQGAHRVLGELEQDLHDKLKPGDVLQLLFTDGKI